MVSGIFFLILIIGKNFIFLVIPVHWWTGISLQTNG